MRERQLLICAWSLTATMAMSCGGDTVRPGDDARMDDARMDVAVVDAGRDSLVAPDTASPEASALDASTDGVAADAQEACTRTTLYRDGDGDGYGDPLVSDSRCPDTGWVTDHTDCNDSTSDAHPGATEVCDGVDNDCDGTIDTAACVQSLRWARQPVGNDLSSARGVVQDSSGNVYALAEVTEGNMVGPAAFTGVRGGLDLVLLSFTANNEFRWSRKISGPGYDFAVGLAIDADRIFVAGRLGPNSGSVTFEGSTASEVGFGDTDGVVAAYDRAGNHLWHRILGASHDDGLSSIAAAAGRVIVGGWFFGQANSARAWLLNANDGAELWATMLQGTVDRGDSVASVAIDASSVYLGGSFMSATLSDGVHDALSNAQPGTGDAFIAKLAINGQYQWIISEGGPDASQSVDALAINPTNANFAAAMSSSGPIATFPAGLPLFGRNDIGFAEYTSAGVRVSASIYGSEANDTMLAIAYRANGNLVTVGGIGGPASASVLGATFAHSTDYPSPFIVEIGPSHNVVFQRSYDMGSTNAASNFNAVSVASSGQTLVSAALSRRYDFATSTASGSTVFGWAVLAFRPM